MKTTNECRVELIDSMGSDLTVVNAARVSFDKESDWDRAGKLEEEVLKEKDAKLINYLAKHNHWTPFAHCMVTLRETVPVFVARQRFKHMVGFAYNEVSRRYVDDEPEFFIPKQFRLRPPGSVKQGSEEPMHEQDELNVVTLEVLSEHVDHSVGIYNTMIEKGICPEQARMILPQNMMTSYYVTGSLAAWARAYKQRIDAHAQKEIQDLAKKWDEIIQPLFPVAWKSLTREN